MHISSVFFAIFDDDDGPRILYQVPEDLITPSPKRGMNAQPPTPVPSDSSNLNTPSIEVEPSSVPDPSLVRSSMDGPMDGQKDSSLRSGKDSRRSNNSSRSKLNASTSSRLNPTKTSALSPNRTSISQDVQSSKTLFEWELVSQFVIPRSDVCGRLTISTTKKHRIIGFPVTVRNPERYLRGSFVFNVCFVFDRSVDVRSYESVVRKLARVLTACEVRL
jgi:nitrogen permease regulator 2-like protein